MEYKVRLKPRAKRFILSQPAAVQNQLIRQLDRLRKDPVPKNSTELDADRQIYRVKCKKYRILYQVQKHKLIILVVSVGDRKGVERFRKELTKVMKKRSSK
ncbi:MAG TPA: type II toxin-antitoxin system RelE/ParE family toxin [Phycisphaerales bacterium]|nr:type II toxin-antitoxin system RelE/ParE family toxin [Phycisphaerales bacterium]